MVMTKSRVATSGGPTGAKQVDEPCVGNLDGVQGNVIFGWAWRPGRPLDRVDLEVLDSAGNVVASARAARYRNDLAERGVGDGFHAFIVTVPTDRLSAEASTFTVRAAGAQTALSGESVRMSAPPKESNLLLSRAQEPVFADEPPFASALLLPPYAVSPRHMYPVHGIEGEISFAGELAGEGWAPAVAGLGGRRIGATGEALVRLVHLPEPSRTATLFLRGARRSIEALEVWIDRTRLQTTFIALPSEQEAVLAFHLPPGTKSIRTSVALRFVLPKRIAERQGNDELVFSRLAFAV